MPWQTCSLSMESITRPSGARWSSKSTVLGVPGPVGRLKDGLEAVGVGLVGAEGAEVALGGVELVDVAHEFAELGHVAAPPPRPGRARHRVVAEVRHAQVLEELAAVGVRVRAHAPLACAAGGPECPAMARRWRRRAPRGGSCAATPRSGGCARWSPAVWAPGAPASSPPPSARRHSPGRSSPWACAGRSSASAGGACCRSRARRPDRRESSPRTRRARPPSRGAWPSGRCPPRSAAPSRSR